MLSVSALRGGVTTPKRFKCRTEGAATSLAVDARVGIDGMVNETIEYDFTFAGFKVVFGHHGAHTVNGSINIRRHLVSVFVWLTGLPICDVDAQFTVRVLEVTDCHSQTTEPFGASDLPNEVAGANGTPRNCGQILGLIQRHWSETDNGRFLRHPSATKRTT